MRQTAELFDFCLACADISGAACKLAGIWVPSGVEAVIMRGGGHGIYRATAAPEAPSSSVQLCGRHSLCDDSSGRTVSVVGPFRNRPPITGCVAL